MFVWKLHVKTQLFQALFERQIDREKLYPGPGLEPVPLAFHANDLPLSYRGQVRDHDRINLLELSFLPQS